MRELAGVLHRLQHDPESLNSILRDPLDAPAKPTRWWLPDGDQAEGGEDDGAR